MLSAVLYLFIELLYQRIPGQFQESPQNNQNVGLFGLKKHKKDSALEHSANVLPKKYPNGAKSLDLDQLS